MDKVLLCDLDLGGNKLKNAKVDETPTGDTSIVNKSYLDSRLGSLNIVSITAAQYATITPDENTLYFIYD